MKKLLYTIFALLFSVALYARNYQPIEILSINRGLSHNGVTSMIEDSRGYLWVGTFDGLNLYNGESVVIFKSNMDTTLMYGNRVRSLCEDKYGRIWIGTDDGVNMFDYAHNKFLPLSFSLFDDMPRQNLTIKQIVKLHDNKMLCLDIDGRTLLFSAEGELLRVDDFERGVYQDIYLLDKHYALILSNRGVLMYDVRTGKSERLDLGNFVSAFSICKVSNNRLLMSGVTGLRLVHYNVKGDSYKFKLDDKIYCKNLQVRALATDYYGGIWIGTLQDGVVHVKGIDDWDEEPLYVSDDYRISSFLPVGNDRLWVGTFDFGLMRFSQVEHPFERKEINGDTHFRKNDMTRLDESTVLFVTKDFRNEFYDIKTDSIIQLMPEGWDIYNVRVCESKKFGYLMVTNLSKAGSFNSRKMRIFSLRDRKEKELLIPRKYNILPNENPKEIKEDMYGNLWLAYLGGIYRMMIDENGEITELQKMNLPSLDDREMFVKTIFLDAVEQAIWFGTATQGIYRIGALYEDNQENLIINHYQNIEGDSKSLSSNFISVITRSPSGDLWVGTEQGGICLVGKTTNENITFTAFTERDGLVNNVVKAIQFDKKGNLWISSNTGISNYNPTQNKFINYGVNSGLPLENFIRGSVDLGAGHFFFLASDGCLYMDANKVDPEDRLPRLQFGDFSLFNEVIKPNQLVEGKPIYTKLLESGDTLNLKYNQNVISFNIDLLQFANKDNQYIRYRLYPIHDKWIIQKAKDNTIYFNGLTHGKYRLAVSASNHSGNWTATERVFINIAPPFWKTTFAYILYGIIFVLSIYFIIRFFVRMQSLKYTLKLESIEKERMGEKQRYFADIAHEIKTPLSLIVAPVTSLLDKFAYDKETKNKLIRVLYQSRKMSQLIEVAQGIQLNDMGLLAPKFTVFQFNKFMDKLIGEFVDLAEYDKKSIRIEKSEDIVNVFADRGMLEKIFNNILNNAIKYTQKGDKIKIDWSIENNHVSVKVSDSGMGIAPVDLPKIFERFYRREDIDKSMPAGLGIGLSFTKFLVELHKGTIGAESVLGEGSCFTVNLPIITNQEIDENSAQSEAEEEIILDDFVDLAGVEISEETKESLVFIVEDNGELRDMLENILGRYYRTRSFSDGADCAEAIKTEWPDIIVSDVMMPKMNGYDLCSLVKSDMLTSHIPVILLSACTTLEDRLRGKECGADLYILKPFYSKYIVTSIETILRNRVKLRERFQIGIPITFGEKGQDTQDNKFLDKLYQLMDENLCNEEVEINNFARELGVNRSLFYKKVKMLTDKTPFDLLKEYRLTKAAQLLETQDLLVEDVYVMTGFKSRNHFSKLFKERFGVPPGRYSRSTNIEN